VIIYLKVIWLGYGVQPTRSWHSTPRKPVYPIGNTFLDGEGGHADGGYKTVGSNDWLRGDHSYDFVSYSYVRKYSPQVVSSLCNALTMRLYERERVRLPKGDFFKRDQSPLSFFFRTHTMIIDAFSSKAF